MNNQVEYEASSGNIFSDLGLHNAEERLAKAKLASKLIDLSREKKLTQKKIAQILGIDQPKISALYRGRLADFSIARLMKFLTLLEQDVEIVIKDKSNAQYHFGHLNVILHGQSQ
jgi:predicted XRE-type DNA-binding protein